MKASTQYHFFFLIILAVLGLFSCQADGGGEEDFADLEKAMGNLDGQMEEDKREDLTEETGDGRDPALKFSNPAVVLAEAGLTLRSKPDVAGKKISVIPQYGQVDVLDEKGPRATIEGMESRWMQVETVNGEWGYVFGGFLGFRKEKKPHCWCDAEKSFVSVLKDVEPGEPDLDLIRGLESGAYSGTKRLPCFINLAEFGADWSMGEYAISPSGRWLAMDQGTWIFGSVIFIDLHEGKIVNSADHTRDDLVWEGEKLTFWSRTGNEAEKPADSDYPFWVEIEEMIFEDGKIISTGNFGKTQTE